ncbi:MAG: TIGR04076 family protein [Candidatus Bathyarchaeota archaeon]|nr:TIGR04076 family protein [Candidatus Bathyarchaeota archaeon]
MSRILVRVVGGKCSRGYHKIGDTFEIDYDDATTPQGICLGAFGSIFPYIMVLLCDGEFFWSKTKKTRIHCPDPKGIVLEIEKSKTS